MLNLFFFYLSQNVKHLLHKDSVFIRKWTELAACTRLGTECTIVIPPPWINTLQQLAYGDEKKTFFKYKDV